MAPSTLRLRIGALAACAAIAATLPNAASAASTVPAAAPSAYNTTPNCPVSAANPVCSWNLPADPNNAFTAADYGQCPYWAAEKFPALVANDPSSDPEASNWDGGTWLEHAQQEGLSISTTPAAGDLAVWQGTASDPVGHVAYVETVASGAIVVSQMDGNSAPPFPALQGSTEYISASDLSYFQQTYGLEFIVTGAANSTPLAAVLDLTSVPATVLTQLGQSSSTATAQGSSAATTTTTAPANSPASATPASPARARVTATPVRTARTHATSDRLAKAKRVTVSRHHRTTRHLHRHRTVRHLHSTARHLHSTARHLHGAARQHHRLPL